MKKWLVTSIATAMIAASVPTAAFAEETQPQAETPKAVVDYFAKDSLDHWAKDDLSDFIQSDNLAGYKEDGVVSIKPDGDITRAEFVAIVLRAANVATTTGDVKFTDVPKGQWYYDTVATASTLNLVYGKSDDRFAPNEPISRAEISAILNRFFKDSIEYKGEIKKFDDVQGHWAQPDIEKISQVGIVVGDGAGFKPDANATRAEASSMIRRALHQETKAAPTEQELVDLTTAYVTSANDLLTAKKFDELTAMYDAKTTGFYKAMDLYSIDVLKHSFEQLATAGATVELKVTGDAQYKVKFANDRYAAVEVTGQNVETTATKGNRTQTQTASTDETYLLRKVDGAWKIYGGEKSYNAFVNLMTPPAETGTDTGMVTEPGTGPTGTEPTTGTETGTDNGAAAVPTTGVETGTDNGAATEPTTGAGTTAGATAETGTGAAVNG